MRLECRLLSLTLVLLPQSPVFEGIVRQESRQAFQHRSWQGDVSTHTSKLPTKRPINQPSRCDQRNYCLIPPAPLLLHLLLALSLPLFGLGSLSFSHDEERDGLDSKMCECRQAYHGGIKRPNQTSLTSNPPGQTTNQMGSHRRGIRFADQPSSQRLACQ